MAATPSTMLDLGTPMPPFQLPDLDGTIVSSDQLGDRATVLVVFICPHCPFVRHIRSSFSRFAREYGARGLKIVAINSNDTVAFPDDDVEGMKKEADDAGYTFPYLFDSDQSTAKAFRAACTPDFFLFDPSGRLAYRGQFDSSRPGNNVPVTGADLRSGADAVLAGRTPAADQRPSAGCNIKWKPENSPDYFPA